MHKISQFCLEFCSLDPDFTNLTHWRRDVWVIESPLSFFMKRWKGKQLKDWLKMGVYHGMYCLECCWPYFLLMIVLGWMNILWMGMFAAIIFAEKVWSRRIWIARVSGFLFIILGMLSIAGLIPISIEEDGIHILTMKWIVWWWKILAKIETISIWIWKTT